MAELSSPQAERSVVFTMLSQSKRVGEVVNELRPEHFSNPTSRLLFEAIHTAFYADTPIEPLAIAGPMASQLAAVGGLKEDAALDAVMADASYFALKATPLAEHAALIRRYADRRELLRLANSIIQDVEEDEDPSGIAADISQRSLQIASNTIIDSEITNFGEAGRNFIRTLQFEQEATRLGIDLGVRTKIRALDDFTRGMRPGRLYMGAGEPGVGKSALWWVGALNFATEQGKKAKKDQIGTLILSMEMGDQDSSSRFAQHLGRVDGESIQDAFVSGAEMERIVSEWGRRKDIPLYLNYAPNLRSSQMLALIAEAISRHNVGFVVIDHFRTFDLDKRLVNKNDEDEEKARFLKEQIARKMNVAVVCLAHTRKPNSDYSQGRPHMADLRGSGQISAHADMVSFLYRPIVYADQKSIDEGEVSETDAEIIHRKNRQGPIGTGKAYFNPSIMDIR